jgi:hypothetical protein
LLLSTFCCLILGSAFGPVLTGVLSAGSFVHLKRDGN